MAEEEPVWLTQEAYDRLTAELEYLTGPWRIEIAKKIDEARSEGDLRENGGYHAAKDEQGRQEARIRELQRLLKNAVVGQPDGDVGAISAGSLVTARVAGREMTFIVGNHEISAGTDTKVFSEDSPIGQAIMGLSEGQQTSYTAPNGKDIAVEIISVARYQG
ncbi:MAG TPA: transcription elongation factor GreA [Pseudoclavibacter sp.]|nr:transcription elongation factor GreA [Pseudoclavibacter sp.]